MSGDTFTSLLAEGIVECPACGRMVNIETEIIVDNNEGQGGDGIHCTLCPQKGDNK